MMRNVTSGPVESSCIFSFVATLLSMVMNQRFQQKLSQENLNLIVLKFQNIIFLAEEWGSISEEGKNLIKRMLTLEPSQRISAEEAYNDPWIQKNTKDQPINAEALKKLGQFIGKNKIRAVILQFIATQVMSTADKKELEKSFKAIDKNGDGQLCKEELFEGCLIMIIKYFQAI